MLSRLGHFLLVCFSALLFVDLRLYFVVAVMYGFGFMGMQLVCALEAWNGVLRTPTAVNAIAGIISAALFTVTLYRCLHRDFARILGPMQFLARANLLPVLLGLTITVMSIFAFPERWLELLAFVEFQAFNLTMTLLVLHVCHQTKRRADEESQTWRL